MTEPTHPLNRCARAVSQTGNVTAARYLFQFYSDRKRWTAETYRARWDGAAALLSWWHAKDSSKRPPLDNLSAQDARDFLSSLERRGLARTTVKGYRSGADALTKALRGARTIPLKEDPTYTPFDGIYPRLEKREHPQIDADFLAALPSPLSRAKLELLAALLDLGMSVPEVCACIWRDVNLESRFLIGYKKRSIQFGVVAVMAFERLLSLSSTKLEGSFQRVLGWNADTARRWLKRVRSDEFGDTLSSAFPLTTSPDQKK